MTDWRTFYNDLTQFAFRCFRGDGNIPSLPRLTESSNKLADLYIRRYYPYYTGGTLTEYLRELQNHFVDPRKFGQYTDPRFDFFIGDQTDFANAGRSDWSTSSKLFDYSLRYLNPAQGHDEYRASADFVALCGADYSALCLNRLSSSQDCIECIAAFKRIMEAYFIYPWFNDGSNYFYQINFWDNKRQQYSGRHTISGTSLIQIVDSAGRLEKDIMRAEYRDHSYYFADRLFNYNPDNVIVGRWEVRQPMQIYVGDEDWQDAGYIFFTIDGSNFVRTTLYQQAFYMEEIARAQASSQVMYVRINGSMDFNLTANTFAAMG